MSLEISYNIKRREKDSRTGSRKSTSRRKSTVLADAIPFSYSKKAKKDAEPPGKVQSSSQSSQHVPKKPELPDHVVLLRAKLEQALNKFDSDEDLEISSLLTEVCSLFSEELAKMDVPLITPTKPAPLLPPTNYKQQEQALQKLIKVWSEEERTWESIKEKYTNPSTSQPQFQTTATAQTPSTDTPTSSYTSNNHLQNAQHSLQKLSIQLDELKPPLKQLEHYAYSASEQYSALIPRLAANSVPSSPKNLIKQLRDL